jgi:hypothetical protein
VAVHRNSNNYNALVIAQEKSWDEENDTMIFVQPQRVDALVEKLMEYKAICEQAIRDGRGRR